MASERQNDRSAFSWTAPKGLSIIGLFVVLALISELIIVSFFATSGLTESAALPISPLFHILPLAVIVVLVSSWIYLTNHIANEPHRIVSTKTSKTRSSRRRHTRHKKTSLLDSVTNMFAKIGNLFSSNGTSASQRLSFDRVALESIIPVLTIFLLSILLLAVIVYPRIFADFASGLYSTNSPLQGLMQGLANALVPISGALNGIASGFGNVFQGLVPHVSALTGADLMFRYVFCQNAAAWISAFAALAYVRYFIKPSYTRK